jgi:phosphate acetyltransferase
MCASTDFVAMLADRVRRAERKRIVFPESTDPRVLEAASRLKRDGLVEPVVPSTGEHLWRRYFERRRHKGVSERKARQIVRLPLYASALMVAEGEADGFVGGAENTTAETVRAAIHCIGPSPGIRTISSFFVVASQARDLGHNGLLLFADCAVVVEPTTEQLSDIAIATAANTAALLGIEPRVAMLSFSTRGSAAHPCIDRIAAATALTRERFPALTIDGELQADAALVPDVARRKGVGSTVAGRAKHPDLP